MKILRTLLASVRHLSICLLVFKLGFSSALPAKAGQRHSRDNAQGGVVRLESNGPLQEPQIIPGEVLVKFRTTASVERATARTSAVERSSSLQTASDIERVLERYGVSSASRLFPATHHLGDARVNPTVSSSARALVDSLDRIVLLKAPKLKDDIGETMVLVAALGQHPDVEYAEPNTVMKTMQSKPNDRYYDTSGAWGQDYGDLWGLHNINAEGAWSVTRGEGVIVAVIDTGVDYKHKDIAANIWQNPGENGTDAAGQDKRKNGVDDDGNGYVDDWRGWDFVVGPDLTPEDNDPMDDVGHGTHVAGIVAALGNNRIGTIGVAPAAKIMALKGLGQEGGATAELSKAIRYAADNGARVINASWGSRGLREPQTLREVIDYAHDVKGVVFVASAGNANAEVEGGQNQPSAFPAAIRNAITVAASDHSDARASFSNFGSKIDVAAPGGGDVDPENRIFEARRSVLSLLSSKAVESITISGRLVVGKKYLRQAGTSMSAPHVAGVAALVLAQHPEYTPEQVRQALRLGSDDTGRPGFDAESGYGRINAARAVAISAPLAPRLTGIRETDQASYQVAVQGLAAGPDFASWTLEYGAGSAPSDWMPIASSTNPVREDLLSGWNTAALPDGVYTLRLSVANRSERRFEDRLRVSISNGRLGPRSFITLINPPGIFGPEDVGPRVKTGAKAPIHVFLDYPYVAISKVECFEGTQLIGALSTPNQEGFYSIDWTPGPIGTTTITVVITTSGGTTVASQEMSVAVLNTHPPEVMIAEPANLVQGTFMTTAPAKIKLAAIALDTEDEARPPYRVAKVEFFIDDKLIGEDKSPTGVRHQFRWKHVAAGTYILRVKATDSDGVETRTLPLTIIVK